MRLPRRLSARVPHLRPPARARPAIARCALAALPVSCLLACVPGGAARPAAGAAPTSFDAIGVPAAPPPALASLVAVYGANGDTLVLFEESGRLLLLGPDSARRPLVALADDAARLVVVGRGDTVQVERDGATPVALHVRGTRHARLAFATDAGGFRIVPQRPVEDLRREALAATPPPQPDSLRQPDLVDVTTLDPSIRLDVRYATANNFMGARFYDAPRAFLQRPAAQALARVSARLRPLGLGLLVHDAYRPWYVTRMFWDATPPHQREFVANPANGSRHNRGAAVDLTLYDLATGTPLELPSGYDEFSPRAAAGWPGGTARQRALRDLLRRAMAAEGFAVYAPEWWHFDHASWREWPVLNVRFDQIDGVGD